MTNLNSQLKYSILIKIQLDETICRYLFTAKSLYMFLVSQHPSSGALKTVTAASGTGHNTGAATSLQRGVIGTGLCVAQDSIEELNVDEDRTFKETGFDVCAEFIY